MAAYTFHRKIRRTASVPNQEMFGFMPLWTREASSHLCLNLRVDSVEVFNAPFRMELIVRGAWLKGFRAHMRPEGADPQQNTWPPWARNANKSVYE